MFEEYPDYLTPKEVQELLCVSNTTVYALMKNRKIPAFKLGEKIWRIPKQSLADYLLTVAIV